MEHFWWTMNDKEPWIFKILKIFRIPNFYYGITCYNVCLKKYENEILSNKNEIWN